MTPAEVRRNARRGTMVAAVSGIVSMTVALLSALHLAGRPARTVDIVGIFGGGMGAGASLVSTIRSLREKKPDTSRV